MPDSKTIYTRIKNRYDTASNFESVSETFTPLKGEIIFYDVDNNLKHRKMKIGDGTTKIGALPFADDTEHTVVLEEDLYAYTPVGQISGASNTTPVKVASAGDTLKTVFNTVFGIQQDTQPTITTSNVKLNVNDGTTSYGGGEYGAAVASTDVTITFTLANSGTAQYGYRCGDKKTTTSDAVFYYPVDQQSTNNPSDTEQKADIKIILPVNKSASIVSGGGDLIYSSKASGSNTNNILYYNFNDSKQVKIKVALPAGRVKTDDQTRYGQISASVNLGAAQDESGTAITNFLTYLEADPDATTTLGAAAIAALSCDPITNTAGAYTIKKGSKYNYRAVTNSTSIPTKSLAVSMQTSCEDTITTTDGTYIWFLMPNQNKTQIQEYALNQWNNVNTTYAGTTTFTWGTGDGALSATYYAYRTDKMESNTAKYRINKEDN